MGTIEGYIEGKGEEARRKVVDELRKKFADKLAISLPKDLAKVLVTGGIVESGEVEEYDGALVELQIGDKRVLARDKREHVFLEYAGKYRYYLILERIGDKEGE